MTSTAPRASLIRLAVYLGLDLVSVLAYLASGLLVLLLLALTPEPGAGGSVTILQGALTIGWLAVGAWLFVDLYRGRRRAFATPVVAWAWAYLVMLALSGQAYLNIGY